MTLDSFWIMRKSQQLQDTPYLLKISAAMDCHGYSETVVVITGFLFDL